MQLKVFFKDMEDKYFNEGKGNSSSWSSIEEFNTIFL